MFRKRPNLVPLDCCGRAFEQKQKQQGKKVENKIITELFSADEIYNVYMARMRAQREEEMKRRYESFSHEQEKKNQENDFIKMKKIARLKLYWRKNVIYDVIDLKSRLKAKAVFKSDMTLVNNTCVLGFE